MSAAKKLTAPTQKPAMKPAIVKNNKPKPAPQAKPPRLSVVTSERFAKPSYSYLDGIRSAAFVCDGAWNITYVNANASVALSELESQFQASGWKSFDASSVEGLNLSSFFGDETAEFKRATDAFRFPYEAQVSAFGRTFNWYFSALENSAGYVVEWSDVTKKLADDLLSSQRMAALDSSSVCMMLADLDFRTIYLNYELKKKFAEWEPQLQSVFGPSFSAEAIIGRCIDDFHKNPSHQRRLLADEKNLPWKTHLKVADLRIDLAANAIRDQNGKIIGYTTEWHDVTARMLEEEAYKAEVKEISDRMEFLSNACSTDLANAMQALANGDLTVTLTPKTPLLDIPEQADLALMAETFNGLRNRTVKSVEAYNEAKVALGALIAQAQIAVGSIADASNEVMTGNDDLAQRTEEQAASLEETASSMEEMTSTVKQNADNAKQANQLAMQARESAEKGGQVVNSAVATMEEINAASKRIADIISVIDEIAFQTNLLALNAAVEAARVGEQGRGFAVVAAEVRNLAGRSATAAKEIKGLVQDSVQKVQEGSSLVNQSGAQLDEIVTSVKKVADIIAEITAAAQEQSAGIEQVNRAIVQMDQITQQNAALVEEASAASQSMNRQAGDLQTVIERFTIEPEFVQQLQAKIHAEQSQAAASAKRAARPEPQRGASVARAAAPSATSKGGDLDDFEEF